MIRTTGMVIDRQLFRSVVRFCGIFMCRNGEGNAILREMEPPRHDEWNPDHPEKGVNRKPFNELTGFVRECIAQLAPANNEKVISIPELSQFLPDDEDSPDQGFEGEPDERPGKAEGFDRKPEERKIIGRPIQSGRRTQPDSGDPTPGDLDTEDTGTGDGDGGSGNGEGGEGNGEGGNGGGGKSEGGKGGKGGRSSKPTIPIHCRAFPTDATHRRYQLVITPKQSARVQALLSVAAVGDDALTPLEIVSATLGAGKTLPVAEGGTLGPLQLPTRGTIQIAVELADPRRLSLEVTAHEA